MTTPLRVILADDHPSFLEALALILSLDGRIEIVGTAANGREAVELAATLRPDGVLMDLHMPVMDGIDAARAIAEEAPSVKVIMLTASHSLGDAARARAAGIAAYLTKDRAGADVASAVIDIVERASTEAAAA